MNNLRGISGRSFAYSDEDHLLTAGGTTYQYNWDGFLTTKTRGSNVTLYDYSSSGELLSVTLPDGTIIEYTHDPLGRRIAKKVNGVVTEKYLWQNLTRLLAVYDGSDNLIMRFEYADGRMPVSKTKDGTTYYLTYDQVGSLRIIADAASNVVKKVDYDSFGNIISDTNPLFDIPFGFAGGLHDRDTGLVRFGYRDYDPDVGRWTTKDPIGFFGGDTDLYWYCMNDPVNWVDPEGLWTLFGGGGIRATLPVAGGEAGIVFVLGTEGKNFRTKLSAYAEAFVAGGLSIGRGIWGGFWSGEVSEIACAIEIGVDTPFGSISFLFDKNLNFGLIIGGPSIGAGAFAKEKPFHVKESVNIIDEENRSIADFLVRPAY